jgi:hypothetical protein
MSEPSVSSIAIYQLRVVLCGVSPLVWRRLLVVSTTSIAELHEILQSAFGGAANIYTASLYKARPMGFRIRTASSSGAQAKKAARPPRISRSPCEAGDAGRDLDRGQNDIERPAADRSRISDVKSKSLGRIARIGRLREVVARKVLSRGEIQRRERQGEIKSALMAVVR